MPTIERVERFVFRAPVSAPVANAFGAMSNRPAVFVRVTASDGAWGWGEVFANFPPVGAEHRARLVDSIFLPLLVGMPSDDAGATFDMLSARTRTMAIQCGEPGPFAQVCGAIDQALWDMAARRANRPLWRHLGGTSGAVRVYASGIGPDAVVDIAERKRDEGFRAFKLKVGFGAQRDAANLRALREALGDDMTIMLDANQAWTPEEASGRIDALREQRPHWIEEPMTADQPLAAWQQLASVSAVPIAAGENIRGLADFVSAIEGRCLGFVQPDVGKWGGISGALKVASHAAARGVAFCPHWLAGGIGLAASMHLVAAAGTPSSYMEVDANPNPLREDVAPMQIRDGIVVLPEAPGIGVEPDLRRLARFEVAV